MPLLWVIDDENSPVHSLSFAPGLDDATGTFNQRLKAYYMDISDATNGPLTIARQDLTFEIKNSCLSPDLNWVLGTDSYNFFERNSLSLTHNQSETWVLTGDSTFNDMCKGSVTVGLKLYEVTEEDGTPVTDFDETVQGGYDRVEIYASTQNMPVHLTVSNEYADIRLVFSPNNGKDLVGTYTYEVIYEYAPTSVSGTEYKN